MGENSEHADSCANSLETKHETLGASNTTEKMFKRPLETNVSDRTFNGSKDPKKLCSHTIPSSIKLIYKKSAKNTRFIYGNYDRYYGYRIANDFKDVRLDAFGKHRSFFEDRSVLDIGCNNGLITISVARNLNVKRIVGIDIDRHLVDRARTFLANEKRNSNENGDSFPFNVEYKVGNYVLVDEKLLDLEKEQFDTILCLSVTKWIHLNSGDDGLKLAFRRMYKQLLPGGRLILEAQEWKSYKRRKNLSPDIAANYKNIKLFPEMFDRYLLGSEVGFEKVFTMDVPKHNEKGFQRPIKVFVKGSTPNR